MDSTHFVLALDYELYFGTRVGSVERCMLEPVDELIRQTRKLGMKLTLFVDSGCLLAYRRHGQDQVFNAIAGQLQRLYREGHDVQLHIHPHWQDTTIVGDSVDMDTGRYRLHDFDEADRVAIVRDYKAVLEDIIEAPVTAYRAGGWCLQPFDKISAALAAEGVAIDSTVYSGGLSRDTGREFDFLRAPDIDHWHFDQDPVVPVVGGQFLELPITPVKVTPWFYLRSQVQRKLQPQAHANFGDGQYLAHDWRYYQERLLSTSISPASVDGAKASQLPAAYAGMRKRGGSLLNVMGHPKALAPASIADLVQFLGSHKFEFQTIRSYAADVAATPNLAQSA
ncbi:MAG: hypothetical protein AB8B93_05180 [Pseudomonadales bacterium]